MEIAALSKQGWSLSAIARHVGHHPNRGRPMTGTGDLINLADWCPTCHRRLDGNVNPDWPHPAQVIWPHLLSVVGGWRGAGRTRCRSR